MDAHQLQIRRGLDLENKILLTERRINEWYKHWCGEVYVSFSGGKDSTVLLDICRRLYPDIEAVFIDTGLEYPEIRQFVKTYENVIWLKPKMSFKEVINKYGYPIISKTQASYIQEYRDTKSSKLKKLRWEGAFKISEKWKFLVNAPFKISDKCCDVMKKAPVFKYEQETGKKPIMGTLAEESNLRLQNYFTYGCNAFDTNRPVSNPMAFWTEQDVLNYLVKNNLSIADCYGNVVKANSMNRLFELEGVKEELTTSKCTRTGCMFCMFGIQFDKNPNRFQMMKQTHPKQYNYCIRKENGLNIGKVLDYIGIEYK